MDENYYKNLAYLELIKDENFVSERIDSNKAKAEKIVYGKLETNQDLINRLRYQVSQYYRIPFFSEFLEGLTLENLLLEVCLMNTKPKTTAEQSADFIKENIEDAAALFDDLEEEIAQGELSAEEKADIQKDIEKFKEGGFNALVNKKENENG